MPTIPSEYQMLIDGKLIPGAGEPLEVLNPATEEVVARVANVTQDELDAAVTAAANAYRHWREVPVEERVEVVRQIGKVVLSNCEELATILTTEQGKPLVNARREVERAARWCDGLSDLDIPWEEARETETHDLLIRRVPLGVVAAIVPWNFPVTLALWKIIPALMAGNTVVVKPSPFTPLTALRIGELVASIVPPGVINVISGDDSLGPRLTSHADIAKIAFTGSSQTGKRVMESASRNLVRITLELGGNDPAIVLPDVDVEELAPKLFWACFQNSAQYCLAAKRVYVPDAIYDALAAAVAEYASTVVVGNGRDDETQLGPIQNRGQYDKVVAIIESCRAAGMQFLVPPVVPEGPGYFIKPTIVDNPPDDSPIVTEEPFGPIVPFLRYHDIDDAIARANDSVYGLGASVWGTDVGVAQDVASRIESGVVWVNEVQRLEPDFPFGGRRLSGVGAENGVEGILAYTDVNVISTLKGS